MKVKMGCYLGGSARNSHSFTLSCNRYSQSTYYRPETILGDGNTAVQRTESQPSQNLHNSQETSELKNQTSTMMPDISFQRNEERDEVSLLSYGCFFVYFCPPCRTPPANVSDAWAVCCSWCTFCLFLLYSNSVYQIWGLWFLNE